MDLWLKQSYKQTTKSPWNSVSFIYIHTYFVRISVIKKQLKLDPTN